MSAAIRVENVSKVYEIGADDRSEYETLRETIVRNLKAPFRRMRPGGSDAAVRREHWALRDVSFDVPAGDVVGIIGRNGAGKSTLLKILSRITEPTSGRMEIRGRVVSLLEVGTGFHPELTGRENVFLNGAILGMSRQEIRSKFDEIVAFSEIGAFLDTPVKRYSSGMYVRLGFSVAAHLDPEVLLVDEVLAVGDAEFQKKCLAKMLEVSRAGRTVLVVSHNMVTVKNLCKRGVLIDKGRVVANGSIEDVIDQYLVAGRSSREGGVIPSDAPRVGTGKAKVIHVELTDSQQRPVSETYLGQPFRVSFTCEVLEDITDGILEVTVTAVDGAHVLCALTSDDRRPPLFIPKGIHTFAAEIDTMLLPRSYSIDVGLHHANGTTIDLVSRVVDFTVLRVAADRTASYKWHGVRGYVRPDATWQLTLPRPIGIPTVVD